MKRTLSLLLLLACGSAYASDIIPKQWNKIVTAIAKKNGSEWLANFNGRYKQPSEAGVRELAQQFDFTEDDMHGDCWMESNPPQLGVKVNGETIYGLTPGKCTDIIEAVRNEKRKNNPLT